MDHILFLLFCAIAGSSFILMKKAALVFGPVAIAALRCLCATVVLAAFWRWMPTARLPDRREVRWLLVLAVFGYAYPFVTMPYLVSRHGSGFIGMMVCFVPLMTVLLAIPMLRTYPSRLQLVGILGGLVCIALIMWDGVDRQVPPGQLALALSVPLGFAYTNLTTRKHLNSLPPYVLTFSCVALVALAMVPVGLMAEPVKPQGDTRVAVASVVTLGVASTAFALVIFFRLLQRRGALYAGMVTYLVPLVAVLWGWADAEAVTTLQILALLGVLAMVAVVQFDLGRRFGGRVELRVLDHTEADQSERIRDVMQAAYAAEGRLIGVEDFAPLKRGSGDIRAATSTFYGYVSDGRLVGVAEVEEGEEGAVNIAGFVVHPTVFRQGIGSRLLQHVLKVAEAARFTVSTSTANAPAIAFYEEHGFRVREHWTIEGIDMVTLEARGSSRAG